MHTFKGQSCVILHNGDYSGDATIRVLNTEETEVKAEVIISCNDLFEFVAAYVKDEKMGQIEKADFKQLFGIGNRNARIE